LPRLRLSLTISGAARFGAYEGGALATLIVASRALHEDILVIDSIASASVGSVNDLLMARSLLGGVDPLTLFDLAWVHNAQFEHPEAGPAASPPSWRAVTTLASGALGPDGPPSGPVTARQCEPVRLSVALSNLDNLIGVRPGPERDEENHRATTPDWYSLELTSAATPDDFLVLLHAADTSGSTTDFPCYVDAAAVDHEALGRTIDLTEDIASQDERLHLVLDPEPTRLSRGSSACDDLARLEKSRTRFEWMERTLPATDVVTEARRIMGEREADRSDDYAALLDSLCRVTHNPGTICNGLSHTVESRQDEFLLGYRTVCAWLERRLHLYLSPTEAQAVFDRINTASGRIDRKSSRGEGARSSTQSCNRMAALGH
jgi:hypothetical protein